MSAIPLTILVCTLGVPPALGPDHEHCYFYSVEIHLSPAEVPATVVKFCDLVREIAVKRGGSLAKCEVTIEPKLKPPPEPPIRA